MPPPASVPGSISPPSPGVYRGKTADDALQAIDQAAGRHLAGHVGLVVSRTGANEITYVDHHLGWTTVQVRDARGRRRLFTVSPDLDVRDENP